MSRHAPSDTPTPTPIAVGSGPPIRSLQSALVLLLLLGAVSSGAMVEVTVGHEVAVVAVVAVVVDADETIKVPTLRGKESSQQLS